MTKKDFSVFCRFLKEIGLWNDYCQWFRRHHPEHMVSGGLYEFLKSTTSISSALSACKVYSNGLEGYRIGHMFNDYMESKKIMKAYKILKKYENKVIEILPCSRYSKSSFIKLTNVKEPDMSKAIFDKKQHVYWPPKIKLSAISFYNGNAIREDNITVESIDTIIIENGNHQITINELAHVKKRIIDDITFKKYLKQMMEEHVQRTRRVFNECIDFLFKEVSKEKKVVRYRFDSTKMTYYFSDDSVEVFEVGKMTEEERAKAQMYYEQYRNMEESCFKPYEKIMEDVEYEDNNGW